MEEVAIYAGGVLWWFVVVCLVTMVCGLLLSALGIIQEL